MERTIKKIWNLYNNLSIAVKASIWFTLCNIIQKGISLLTTPIFTRILSAEQYGTFSVYQSWYAILSIFGTLNLYSSVYNNGMIKFPENKKDFTSSMLSLSTCVSLVLFSIYLINTEFWNNIFGLSTIFIVAMFAEMIFTPAFSFWSAKERFEFKYKKMVIYTLIMAVLCPVISIISVLCSKYKAEARVVGMVLAQVLFSLLFYVNIILKGKKIVSLEYWKFALKFNLPLIPHYLSIVVLQQIDRIMISKMVGNDKAAIYSIAYNISMLMTLITNGINSSYTPYAYQKIKKDEYKKLSKVAEGLLIFIGIASFIVMALAPELIKLFATTEYYEAIWIIPPVAASVFFMFFYSLFTTIEFYYEKTFFVMIASVLGAILNIILNYFGILRIGYLVAGYTTLICYMFFGVLHYIFSCFVLKKHGLKNPFNSKSLSIISSSIIFGMICMLFIYKHLFIRYLLLLILFIIVIIFRNKIIDLYKNLKNK